MLNSLELKRVRQMKLFPSVDVSTRGKRRKAIVIVLETLEDIRDAESLAMERIPLNLQSGLAYALAQESINAIECAIMYLLDAY